ncbi:SDR family NAD(P)-dependent oxidoreductase [Devosia sp. XJ19-1]|uniref:SDR family NAD(P)-dependent oxidoreductase n=1 Tax=Devosia ureilytica TaxID=2952754 RepID=A0A9Q4ALF7_9HYPH|nr:SDR family NAD(P)-dependent oxidoreductase [Devosia ureilytica]MCP8882332.1 SDR family NAD(P)-dependent oxidoreductase [Devosia ureilytica]MCP8885782.1 SDR family NAD(P)-dependent oxidoreductase [Devosia ureilytica]
MSAKTLALVTGASSGIGRLYAERLAARGHDLILVGRNQRQLQQAAADFLIRYGATCEVLAADLSRRDQLHLVEQRLTEDDHIALLVNSAGLVSGGPLGAADADALTTMLDVNVVALTRLCSAAARSFGQQRRGAIVNFSSAMAFFDTARSGAYAASKAFVLSMSYSLDLELRDKGVRVQVVLPGYTRTPMLGDNHGLAADMLMEVETLVDAALAGFDKGEFVTIPSLEDLGYLARWEEARTAMRPHLSLRDAASRYRRPATPTA